MSASGSLNKSIGTHVDRAQGLSGNDQVSAEQLIQKVDKAALASLPVSLPPADISDDKRRHQGVLVSDFDEGPWGQTDGSRGDFRDHSADFIELRTQSGVGRSASDSAIRVVAGRLGAGKSTYLRRMQDIQRGNLSVYAAPYTNNSAHIDTRDLAMFAADMAISSGNTEAWKRLWRRAIFLSAYSYLFAPGSSLKPQPSTDRFRQAADYSEMALDAKFPRQVADYFSQLATRRGAFAERNRYLRDPRWGDLEALVAASLAETRPIYFYIDAIDDNYKYSPSLWAQCQRGLYYAVMDLLRDYDALGGRLHVVIAIRDITLASVQASEHASRYSSDRYTNVLKWSYDLIEEFIGEKLRRLDAMYFVDPQDRSLRSFTGHDKVMPNRPDASAESIDEYLIRHTRQVPRDIVALGNRLCRFIRTRGHSALTPDALRRQVSQASREVCNDQLSQASNQLWADLLPRDAPRHEYEDVYLSPNDHQINDNRNRLLRAIEATEVEAFGQESLDRMEEELSRSFGGRVYGADILWQNGLLGTILDDKCEFYSLSDVARTDLPRDGKGRRMYVWNPLIFDVLVGLRATLPYPHWPRQ